MRRFEFREGTSDKFWQIACEDTAIRVQFGRIGTAGQTQLKSFASAEVARAEMEKLVKEKTKKGYKEVEGTVDAATAPGASAPRATAPTPASPPPAAKPAKPAQAATAKSPPSPSGLRAPGPVTVTKPAPAATEAGSAPFPTVVLSDAALREVAPSRGSSLVPTRPFNAKALYARLAKAMTGAAGHIEEGKRRGATANPKPPELLALVERAREAFAATTPPETLDLEVQAAAYALIGPRLEYSDDDGRTDDFIRYWCAVAGPVFALHAFAKSGTFHVEATQTSVALVGSPPHEQVWWRARHTSGWRGLRALAVVADDAQHDRLLKEAEALAVAGSPETRAVLAAGFERPAWAEADIAGIAAGAQAPAWLWPLVVSAATIEDARALVARVPSTSGWHLVDQMEAIRFELVARYGKEGAIYLGSLLTAQSGSYGVDRMRTLAEAIAMVGAVEIAEFFTMQLGTKELRAVAAAYLQSQPDFSVVPLAEAAAVGKGALADAARAVLKPIVASGVPAVARAKTSLTGAALSMIVQLEEQTRARYEAAAHELPRVLQAPPWLTKARPASPVVLELTPLDFAESMAWKPGEPQAWLPKPTGGDAESVEQKVAAIRTASASRPTIGESRWKLKHASVFSSLPKEVLLDIYEWVDFSRFNWGYGDIAKGVIAQWGADAIGFVLRSASEDAPAAIEALARANSARVAPLMADAYVRLKKQRDEAAGWLLRFPEAAAVGLLPLALGKPGKARDSAETALRFLAARGHTTALQSVATRYGAEANAGLQTVLAFDALLAYPAKLPKLPPYWSAGAFARPVLAAGGGALPEQAVDAIGTMLAFTSFDDPYPGLLDVREACDRRSLADFAWDLFQAWLVAGASSKEAWAFLGLSIFGDDETARKLTPLVRAWPGEAAHARAVLGLDVLAKIGTDVALMHLHGIAQKLKFKGLQEKAREKIDLIAEARGLSAEELADRLVPDLGLDERGSLDLDFGPRRFKVVFDETLKPFVLDDAGKRLPDLPKPKQTDDAEKGAAATDTWKALKKDAKTIASGQILRLEIAMCAQRRWTEEVFRRFLLEHPLLVHVVRRLVWGAYAPTGPLASAFRVAEDGTFANASDDAFELPPDAPVGIVHRLDLDDTTASAFGQILADYEVLQPFAQLSRETTAPTAEEVKGKKLERVVGLKLPTGKVLGLDNRGWRRGPPQDGGVVCWYEKPLSGGLVACLDLEPGIFTGMIAESPEQKLGAVTLGGGEYRWRTEEQHAIGEMSPIAFSELVRDLEGLRA